MTIKGNLRNFITEEVNASFRSMYLRFRLGLKTKKASSCEDALGGTSEIRTSDTWIFSPLLYQLSYGTSVVLRCKDTTFFNTSNKKIIFFKIYFLFIHYQYICKKI